MKKVFNSFALKIIAIISMTIDHIGFFIFPEIRIFRIIGRLAFPVFAFLCATSMQMSKHKKRYIAVLLCFGIFLSIASYLATGHFVRNVFIDLGIGALCCYLIYRKNLLAKISIAGLFLYATSQYSLVNYSIYGIGVILIFYYFYMNRNISLLVFAFWTLICIYLQTFTIFNMLLTESYFLLLAIVPIMLYNGKRGYYHPVLKYAFYLYYPLHISVLYFLSGGRL